MELILKKQPKKYLASVDRTLRRKLEDALEGLKELKGDIVHLNGTKNMFRLKLDHYRIIFAYTGGKIIIVETIDTRTNIKYRRYR